MKVQKYLKPTNDSHFWCSPQGEVLMCKMGLVWWRMRHFGWVELESHATDVIKNYKMSSISVRFARISFFSFLFFSLSVLVFQFFSSYSRSHCFLSYCMYGILFLLRAAHMMLCFIFGTKTMLIKHQSCGCHWTVFMQCSGFFQLSHSFFFILFFPLSFEIM